MIHGQKNTKTLKYTRLPRYRAVWMGTQLLTFRQIIAPSLSVSSTLLGLLEPEDKSSTICRKVV